MSVDLLPVIVERENAVLPDGCDTWGLKSVRPDLRTYGGFQWPFPGGVEVADAVDESNIGACPRRSGDGLCTATTWGGMASGGIPARTLLLVATSSDDVLGCDRTGKSRHRSVHVVAVVDGERLLRECGVRVDLRFANLRGADLRAADLSGANLRFANLRGVDLRAADLSGADLYGANLTGVDLSGANLYGADLRRANLYGANLHFANLDGVDLRGVDLRGANLDGVNLRGANLDGADLRGWERGLDGYARRIGGAA